MEIFTIILIFISNPVIIDCLTDCRRMGRHLLQHQCELAPESIEGPFYLEKNLVRSNIHEYRPGVPFELTMIFTNSYSCEPIPGLWIAIWQCDAIGYYSGYTKNNPTIPFHGNDNHSQPTDNSTFLRGAQQTDIQGMVQFRTVLPGWYANRTRYIHLKAYDEDSNIYTGQIYFTEHMSDWIHGIFPYYSQKRIFNNYDHIFNDYGGVVTTLYDIKPSNKKRLTSGFQGQIVIGLDYQSVPRQNKEIDSDHTNNNNGINSDTTVSP